MAGRGHGTGRLVVRAGFGGRPGRRPLRGSGIRDDRAALRFGALVIRQPVEVRGLVRLGSMPALAPVGRRDPRRRRIVLGPRVPARLGIRTSRLVVGATADDGQDVRGLGGIDRVRLRTAHRQPNGALLRSPTGRRADRTTNRRGGYVRDTGGRTARFRHVRLDGRLDIGVGSAGSRVVPRRAVLARVMSRRNGPPRLGGSRLRAVRTGF